jgi:hypothetical protein
VQLVFTTVDRHEQRNILQMGEAGAIRRGCSRLSHKLLFIGALSLLVANNLMMERRIKAASEPNFEPSTRSWIFEWFKEEGKVRRLPTAWNCSSC